MRSPTKVNDSLGPQKEGNSSSKRQRIATRPSIVSVEGIVGSGKSGLMLALREEYNESSEIVILQEPTHVWESIVYNGKNLLEWYYYNPRHYGFPFHLLYFLALERQLVRALKDNIHKRLIICERSLLTARRVYYEMLGYKYQSVVNYKIYQKLFEKEGVGYLYPNLMLILDNAPETCVGNISRISSQGKEVITLKYLRQCRSLLKEVKLIAPTCGFLEFTGTIPLEEKIRTIKQLLSIQKSQKLEEDFDIKQRKPLIISIEGNIGAGKSTLLEKIEVSIRNRGIEGVRVIKEAVEEAVEEWEEINDGVSSILELYYQNPSAYAMPFQTLVTWTTMRRLEREVRNYPDTKVIISERSLVSSRHVFAKMLLDEGSLDVVEHTVYEELFKDERIEWMKPGLIVYVQTEPSICLSRIKQRNRNGEDKINLGFLEKCDQYHESMWDLLDVEPRRIDLEDTIDGKRIDWANEILRWSTKLKEGQQDHEERDQMVTEAVASPNVLATLTREELSLPDSSEASIDKKDSEDGEDEEEETSHLFIKIKYESENQIVRIPEEEMNYRWLEQQAKELFPEIGDRTVYFRYIKGNKSVDYIVDETDLQEALIELKGLGRPEFRFEVIVFETPDLFPFMRNINGEDRRETECRGKESS